MTIVHKGMHKMFYRLDPNGESPDPSIRKGNPQKASIHLKQVLRALPKNETLADKLIVCCDQCQDTPNKEYWLKQIALFDAS